jgi:hypothetical protein
MFELSRRAGGFVWATGWDRRNHISVAAYVLVSCHNIHGPVCQTLRFVDLFLLRIIISEIIYCGERY